MLKAQIFLTLWLLGVQCANSQSNITLLSTKTGIPAEVIVQLQEKSGAEATELQIPIEEGTGTSGRGVSVEVDHQLSWNLVHELSPAFQSQGFLIFVSADFFGLNGKPNTVALIQSTDPFVIVRMMGTKGSYPYRSNEEIIKKLKVWQGLYGIEISGAGKDWVKMDILKMPVNIRNFAKDIYKFCPGILGSGINTIDNLGMEIAKNNILSLWWD